jgi:hypothetical protein
MVALIVALAVAVPAAADDPPGNADAAEKCQGSGWQTWKRSDGTGFSNAGQCVSYAAQGGTLALPCTAGSWSAAGVTPCTPASAGYYVSTAGATSQTACSAGTYQPSTGQTSCLAADAGYFVGSSGAASQTACAAGSYQPNTGQTSCLAADPGHYVGSTGATSQTACAAGSYQPSSGQVGCLLADIGSYVASTGATSQLLADPGNYVDATGATSQTACAAGTYQPDNGHAGCLAASLGYYVDSTGAAAQTPCPAGQTTDSTGSTSVDNCHATFVPPALTITHDAERREVTVEGAGLEPGSNAHITFVCPYGCEEADVTVGSDGSFSKTLAEVGCINSDEWYVEASGTTADGDPITDRIFLACPVPPAELVVDGVYNSGTGQWTFTITGSGLSDESPVTVDACTVYDCGTPVPPPAVLEGSFSFTFSTTQCGDLPDYYVKATGTSGSGEPVTSNTFEYPCPVELLAVTYDLGSAQLTVEGVGLDPVSTVHITIACSLGCDGPDVPVQPDGSFFYTQTLECWAGGSPDDTYVEAYGTTPDGHPVSSNRVAYSCPFQGGEGEGDG